MIVILMIFTVSLCIAVCCCSLYTIFDLPETIFKIGGIFFIICVFMAFVGMFVSLMEAV